MLLPRKKKYSLQHSFVKKGSGKASMPGRRKVSSAVWKEDKDPERNM